MSHIGKPLTNMKNSQLHNIHELMPATSRRNLYFDIDGKPGYSDLHSEIISWLQTYVRWVFSGDHFGWPEGAPEPVVLATQNPLKYSCHVVFPQIQFENHEEQSLYMRILLTALAKLQVEMEGDISVPILERVVDAVPYSPFQNFRGPFACKRKDHALRLETQLVPESLFEENSLSCFASHVNPRQALKLPSVDELLECNHELRHFCEEHQNRVVASGGTSGIHDLALYNSQFQQCGRGIIDFAGRPELEVYEEALKVGGWLHADRAKQWASWFRICGVTYSMLEKYGSDHQARSRIWNAHHTWSNQYLEFDDQENVQMVMNCEGKRVSGLPLLMRMVRFDNPDAQVRTAVSRIFRPMKDGKASVAPPSHDHCVIVAKPDKC